MAAATETETTATGATATPLDAWADFDAILGDDPYLSLAEARNFYLQGDAAHDIEHVLRVTRMAIRIAQAEGADVQIVRLAGLFHDVPVHDEDVDSDGANPGMNRAEHHHLAARFARKWLESRQMGTSAIANVVHCIEAHRFRDTSIQPQTLEAKCLYDADKLDSIGAIGVVRAFAYAGAHSSRLWTEPSTAVPEVADAPTGADYTPVHEYVYKLQRVLPALHTETARRIGVGRHAFMTAFFEQLDAEMQAEA